MIVDWAENCERIYATKQLSADDPSDSKMKYRQEIIFLKYLTDVLHYNKQQCFEEWKLISNGIASFYNGIDNDDLDQRTQFNKLYHKAIRSTYSHLSYQNKLQPIVIYQEEIDFLNGLDVPLWVRQYWGCLLFYYKFEIQNTARVQKSVTLNSWCIRHTEVKTKRYGSKCQDIIAQYKLSLKTPVIKDYIRRGGDHYPSYSPAFLVEDGTPAFNATDIEQINDFLQLLAPTKHICTTCGKEFVVRPKTKRTICDECYKKIRREYKTNKDRERRAQKESADRKGAIVYCE